MIVTLTHKALGRAFAEKVVKLKTYMLILNCCINVLSHRNRFESIEELLFLLNISGAASKKTKHWQLCNFEIDFRDNYHTVCLFPDFFKCHVKELIGAILWLSKSNQQGNVSKNFNRLNPAQQHFGQIAWFDLMLVPDWKQNFWTLCLKKKNEWNV